MYSASDGAQQESVKQYECVSQPLRFYPMLTQIMFWTDMIIITGVKLTASGKQDKEIQSIINLGKMAISTLG